MFSPHIMRYLGRQEWVELRLGHFRDCYIDYDLLRRICLAKFHERHPDDRPILGMVASVMGTLRGLMPW